MFVLHRQTCHVPLHAQWPRDRRLCSVCV